MNGVLVIAHGSRAKETEKAMEQIINMVSAELPTHIIQHAYMEFGEINMELGLDILREKGVKDIRVVPYFLFEGIHIKKDIPELIENYKTKYPNITITFGKVLGVDKRLAQVLKDRILDV